MPRSPLERPVRRTASLGTRCWNRIANWFSSDSSASREWTIMTPEERSRTAADIGLSEPDVAFSIRQGHDSRDLLAILGREANRGIACSRAVLRDMARVCGLCTRRTDCRAWQIRAPQTAACPTFCPNRAMIEELRERRAA
ncbi:DUF6455 family protein [uncultured Ferrovibrio sp.]|jgi:hypothetical protein|uniref:DUF6455 family protein n=1 Tax=uncultured Ferrovibrio sp. TaxID=1576913 RepID=UPI002615BA25|nr:DUF6455 family protein [uncultured Ferrovibrio sp.]